MELADLGALMAVMTLPRPDHSPARWARVGAVSRRPQSVPAVSRACMQSIAGSYPRSVRVRRNKWETATVFRSAAARSW